MFLGLYFVEANTELNQQWHFKKDVVSSLSNNPDKKLPDMGWWRNQEHLWYLTRVGFSWRWISSQSSAFSSFSPPSPFQIARGKAPSNMEQLQEMVSHDVFVFVLSLILVFVFVLDFVFYHSDDMQLSQAWTVLQAFDELIKSKHPLLWEYQISGRFIGSLSYEKIRFFNQTWDLSKNLHNRIFGQKCTHLKCVNCDDFY